MFCGERLCYRRLSSRCPYREVYLALEPVRIEIAVVSDGGCCRKPSQKRSARNQKRLTVESMFSTDLTNRSIAFRMDCCEQLIELSHVALLKRRLEGIITVSNGFWLTTFGLFIWARAMRVRKRVCCGSICLLLNLNSKFRLNKFNFKKIADDK